MAFMVGVFASFTTLAEANEFSNIKNKESTMKLLIIGANGSVARVLENALLENTQVQLKLFLRNASRLSALKSKYPSRIELVEGDATDKEALKNAMSGVNVVYANLAGNLPTMARAIVEAMDSVGLKRLIWISSFGVYDGEIPQSEINRISAYLPPHKEAVKIIESSDLDYTIIRAQWFSNANEVDYEITKKGEPFKNPSAYISRKSIAHLIMRLCLEPDFGIRESLGINKP